MKCKEFIFGILLYVICFTKLSDAQGGFLQSEEVRYLSLFPTLIKDSYTAPLPHKVIDKCKNQPLASKNINTLAIKSSMNSLALQAFCGYSTICVVPAGYTISMTNSLSVAALIVHGTVEWTDESQQEDNQYICAGYIAVCLILGNKN